MDKEEQKYDNYSFHRVAIKPEEQIGPHSQASWELSLVTVGKGTREISGLQEPFEAPDAALLPPNVEHCWRFDPAVTDDNQRVTNLSLFLSSAFLESLANLFPQLGVQGLATHPQAIVVKGDNAHRLRKVMEDLPSPSALLKTLETLLASRSEVLTIATPNSPDKRRREQLDIWVACNYSRRITVADAARHVGMNTSAFCTWMRRCMDTTFITYLNDYRIAQAASMLRSQPNTTVAEIAYTSGFTTVSHFNHMFIQRFGISPKRYRTATK